MENKKFEPSKREYFVAAAIMGIGSAYDVDSSYVSSYIAKEAVRIADAVIEELKKPKEKE